MSKIKFHHSSILERNDYIPSVIESKEEFLTVEPELVDGVSLSRSLFKLDDSRLRFKGMKASDFNLHNQLAAGVNLSSAFCVPSKISMVDSVVAASINMRNYFEQNSQVS